MSLSTLFSHDILVWVVLPILIFIGGLSYVSLGTLRIIFVARGTTVHALGVRSLQASGVKVSSCDIPNTVAGIELFAASYVIALIALSTHSTPCSIWLEKGRMIIKTPSCSWGF